MAYSCYSFSICVLILLLEIEFILLNGLAASAASMYASEIVSSLICDNGLEFQGGC